MCICQLLSFFMLGHINLGLKYLFWHVFVCFSLPVFVCDLFVYGLSFCSKYIFVFACKSVFVSVSYECVFVSVDEEEENKKD